MHTISMRHGEHKSPAQAARHSSRKYCFFSYNIRIGIWREYFDLCNGEGIFRPKASSTKLHEPTVCSQLRNDPRNTAKVQGTAGENLRGSRYSLSLKNVRFNRQNHFVICNKPIRTLLAAKALRSFGSQQTQESM